MPELTRRGFLGSLVGGIATLAAVRTFPFRVFSFPSEIVIPSIATGNRFLNPEWITAESLRVLQENLKFTKYVRADFDQQFRSAATVGSTLNIRRPARFALNA